MHRPELHPTDTWVLRYEMSIFTFGGTQGLTATGNGSVNFTITPEPASLALLTLALFTLTHSRRCRLYFNYPK